MSVTTQTLPAGRLKRSYSAKLAVTGGRPTYTWTIAAGALPPGLKVAPSGTISGTPITTGTYPITVAVTDGSNPANHATRALTIDTGP